jgi:uncharacterized membrane protein (UPF0127 family)
MKKFSTKFDLKRCTFFVICGFIAIFIILRAPQVIDAKEILKFNRDLKNYNAKLQILDSDNKKITEFTIAIADDENKKMYGLMNLEELPQTHGMLFPFFKNQIVVMWMKNTRIPLDMLFIDKNNLIANIKINAEPYSLNLISSEKKVKKVLEINGGLSEKLGIKIGQKIKILN